MQQVRKSMISSSTASSRNMLLLGILSVSLLLNVISVPLAVFTVLHQQNIRQAVRQQTTRTLPGRIAPPTSSGTGLVSIVTPAFSSQSWTAASDASDLDYDKQWRAVGTPAWLAYDLSEIPPDSREKVLLVWYNQTGDYDHSIINSRAYNNLKNYTVEANAAPGGGNPPASGWTVLVKVSGNTYHSRQHILAIQGYNWIRIVITALDGPTQNMGAAINVDVYTADQALGDDWIFYGDGITATAMNQYSIVGIPAFANLIYAKAPHYFPVEEDGGIGDLTSRDGARHMDTWLSLFPGKYVGLSYGTIEAWSCADPNVYYYNYVTMVQAVLRAGKIPVIPTIPWSKAFQKCGPAFVQKVETLYKVFPQIINGPDFWNFFKAHQDLLSANNLPNEQGMAAYRQQWADQMLSVVYQVH
jgi:hypothetical protein